MESRAVGKTRHGNRSSSPASSPASSPEAPRSIVQARIDDRCDAFTNAQPYRHIVVEEFLDAELVQAAVAEFPQPDRGEWIHYFHVNERKLGRNKLALMPKTLRAIIEELNSPAFVAHLEKATGIPGLIADPSLEGGGLHQSERGGFLNIHTDFSVHPHRQSWKRRVNLIVYLNDGWQDEYGGHLEMWDSSMQHCVKKISPILNRAVIFDTTGAAFHGHPEPLACPAGMTRKSIALYYFTEEATPQVRATDYRARPVDGKLKSLGMFADKLALALYDRLKRRLGWSDERTSAILARLARWRRSGR
jgi:Rps23 Pro-64 3,4-dihydroxylase Tpa1-like proline 4-hydroxylase